MWKSAHVHVGIYVRVYAWKCICMNRCVRISIHVHAHTSSTTHSLYTQQRSCTNTHTRTQARMATYPYLQLSEFPKHIRKRSQLVPRQVQFLSYITIWWSATHKREKAHIFKWECIHPKINLDLCGLEPWISQRFFCFRFSFLSHFLFKCLFIYLFFYLFVFLCFGETFTSWEVFQFYPNKLIMRWE